MSSTADHDKEDIGMGPTKGIPTESPMNKRSVSLDDSLEAMDKLDIKDFGTTDNPTDPPPPPPVEAPPPHQGRESVGSFYLDPPPPPSGPSSPSIRTPSRTKTSPEAHERSKRRSPGRQSPPDLPRIFESSSGISEASPRAVAGSPHMRLSLTRRKANSSPPSAAQLLAIEMKTDSPRSHAQSARRYSMGGSHDCHTDEAKASSPRLPRSESTYKQWTMPEDFTLPQINRIIRKMRHAVGASSQYHKFKKYTDSVWGSQIVEWLLEACIVTHESQAFALGTLMTCYNLIVPVGGSKHQLNMSKAHLYKYVDDRKMQPEREAILTRYSKFLESKELCIDMLEDIPRKSIHKNFKRIKGCYSGAAIIRWLIKSKRVPEVKTTENAILLGTLILLHNLMSEVGKEQSCKFSRDRQYQKIFSQQDEMISFYDNPLLDSKQQMDLSTRRVDRSPTRFLQAMQGMEGWLERKSKLGFWKKRYFRLRLRDSKVGSHLSYHLNDDTKTPPKGTIPMCNVGSVLVDGRVVKLKMSDKYKGKKAYILRCKDVLESKRWAGALQPFVKATTIEEVLKRSAFGIILNNQQREKLAKQMKFVTYSERTWISKFKKKCDAFHLLHTGKIGVYVRNRTLKSSENSEKEHLLTHQTPISHFGEEMFDRSLCGASVRAETEVTCAVLERSQCEDLFREFPAIKGQIKQFIGRGIISMLQRVSFLKEIAEEKLDILRRGVHCTSYQAEHIVFYEGDVGDDFYMILKGSVMIKRKDRDTDEQVEIATLDTGSYFGEVSLIMDVARTATIVVSEPSLLLSINKKTFGTFLELNGLDMKTVMRTRIIETFKRFQIPFFQAIPDERFPQIAENCQIEKYEKGEVIFEEGEVGDRFFIISYGQVQVEKKGQVISKLGAGKYFGEVALVIEDAVRTATCSTLMQTVLLSMSAEDFKGSFELNPEALADVELKLAGQNAGMRAILHHPRALEKFETFLKTQFATESIHCWKACIEFRKAYNAEIPEASEGNEPEEEQELPKSVVDRAQHLLNRYVRVGSEDEVNIPDKVRRETIQKVDNEELAEDVFFSLEAEIVRLMRNDKLNSFRKTKDFQEILKQVGNYNDWDMTDDMKKKILLNSKALTRRGSLALRQRSGRTTPKSPRRSSKISTSTFAGLDDQASSRRMPLIEEIEE